MKNYILLIGFLAFCFAKAQTYEITYVQSMDQKYLKDSILEGKMKNLPDEFKKDFIKNMGKTEEFVLIYSNGKSIFKVKEQPKKEEEQEEELNVGQSNTKFSFKFLRKAMNAAMYKDHEKNQTIKQENILDKQFLISDSLHTLDWQITNKIKTFGDLKCREVTSSGFRMMKKQKITACYTEDIPINEGPDDYYGLPGLVVDVQIGPINIAMKEIKTIKEDTEINAPTEGQKITKAEFDKLMEDYAKQNINGNGKQQIIRLKNH